MRRDAKGLEREESRTPNRLLQVIPLGQCGVDIIIHRQFQTGCLRDHARLRLDRQLELDAQQAEHVGHDGAFETVG